MPNQFHITEHAQGTYMVEGPASNWIILEDNGVYTVIDGGYPGDVPLVLDSIRRLGLSVKDAAAMLITHGHVDHTGAAAYFASELCVPVLSSHAEHTQMTGEERFQVSPVQILVRAWQPLVFKWMRHVLTVGGTEGTKVLEAKIWTPEQLSALPGAPVAVPTPGHTPGHSAFHLPDAKVLISGDALISGHALSTTTGAQMLHPMFHHERQQAYQALTAFDGLDADSILPGHGKALHCQPAEAVHAALARNPR
ncbi:MULTISPECIES: MBL fold metallo-hydrolase [Glutamicibacter]|uniref:MBL fold metallo-hydrolase n=1 Tax=Glutamicibacter TaxID=1742989 RepID=UPI0025799981|nr:MBL fold metallo-hydrolase [Glutamicibacter sp.]